MNAELPLSEPDFFVVHARNPLQRISRRGTIEKDGHGPVRRGFRERVACEHLRHLGRRAHEYAHGPAGMNLKLPFTYWEPEER